ncbi:MAG TPA: Ppx/GppA phosphatase family protein [Polyangiaceae bacterium]|nr:Ppx/GppA phosphatase family protein [Polyangiaceae bacterium]
MTSKRVAAIDVGTNTVLLLVAEGSAASPRAVVERATITRLGQDVDRTGRLAEDAMSRTLAALSEYAGEIRRLGVSHVDAVCTSAARDADNGREFLERASDVLGTAPRIASGEEEARLTFAGALTDLPVSAATVFDVGGGSTEIIVGNEASEILHATSLDVGSVRLTERCVRSDPPTTADLDEVRRAVEAALSAVSFRPTTPLVGVAGTITTFAAIERRLSVYDSSLVHGARLSRSSLAGMTADLAKRPLAERRSVTGLPPARADVIVAGGVLAVAVLDWAGATEIVVSDKGVRWGLARLALSSV